MTFFKLQMSVTTDALLDDIYMFLVVVFVTLVVTHGVMSARPSIFPLSVPKFDL